MDDINYYGVQVWYAPEDADGGFMAQVIEWPEVKIAAPTREEAFRDIGVVLQLAIEAAHEVGNPVPPPACRVPRASAKPAPTMRDRAGARPPKVEKAQMQNV